MTPEQILFFQVLSDHIHGRPSSVDMASIDESVFYDFIRRQGLLGIFYVQCRDALPSDSHLRKKLYAGFSGDVFRAVNRTEALHEVTAAHEQAGIPLVPMKGVPVSQFYPVPELRTMGDMDLILHHEDRAKSDAIMAELGYGKMVDNHAVWTYHLDVALFEIHDHIMYDPLANDMDYRTYFDQVWDYIHDGQIQPEFHFLYMIAHSAKHIINKGYGIRGFLDLIFFTRGNPQMDWDWITAQLRTLRLLDFTETCFALCERWFQVEMPLHVGKVSDDFFAKTTEKIFLDGLWGHDNEANEVGVSARTARRSQGPYWLTACKMTIHKLFPPYRDMQLIPWYSFVDGRPWLLPAAWVYRWYYCLVHKRARGSKLLREPFARTKEIHAREQWIDSWGL